MTVPDDVRARFEAWLPEVDDLAYKHLAMHEGEYISSITYLRWSAWQAANADTAGEIERLTRGNIGYAQDNVNLIGREHIALKRAEFAESRLAVANALLRDIAGCQWFNREAPATVELIDAHLQGSGDEA